jgi:hypothetical protein
MKKILIVCFTTLITTNAIAQSDDTLYFKIRIDSCIKKTIVFNSAYKEFELAVKNTSSIVPLFNKDNIEIGIKIYVNRIIEDEERITIVKLIIMEKEMKGDWKPLITSEYFPLEELGNERSVMVGSDKELPDFFIQYKISVLYDNPEPNKNKGILELIPALKKSKQ